MPCKACYPILCIQLHVAYICRHIAAAEYHVTVKCWRAAHRGVLESHRTASPAFHSNEASPACTSTAASLSGFPHSIVMMLWMSDLFAFMRSRHLRRILALSAAGVALQGPQASLAAAMASRVSSDELK